MIDVFKTNVLKKTDAGKILGLLQSHFPEARLNFDLHDADKILRVHSEPGDPALVIELLNSLGFDCTELE